MINQKNDTLQNVDLLAIALTGLAKIDITKAKKVVETDFVYRIVYCYEDEDKYINYKQIKGNVNLLLQKQEQETDLAKKEEYNKLIETETKKLVLKEEYKKTMILVNMLNQLSFDYAIKQNKYVYLMHRNDINILQFKNLQKLDDKGNLKNTINLKNINSIFANLYLFLLDKIIKNNVATEEQKKEYEKIKQLAIEKTKQQKAEEQKQETK